MPTPRLEGTLWKRGGSRKNWKQRFFIISDESGLQYFTKEGGKMLGNFKFTSSTRLEVQPDRLKKTGNSESTEFRFMVVFENRDLALAALDDVQQEQWVGVIARHIAIQQAPVLKAGKLSSDCPPSPGESNHRVLVSPEPNEMHSPKHDVARNLGENEDSVVAEEVNDKKALEPHSTNQRDSRRLGLVGHVLVAAVAVAPTLVYNLLFSVSNR
jgi:hypothetical protein